MPQGEGGGATPRLSPSLARLREETKQAEESVEPVPGTPILTSKALAAAREKTKALEESLKDRSVSKPPPVV